MNDTTPEAVSKGEPADSRLGQILLETGKIRDRDVEQILHLAKKKGLHFGEAAVKLKLTTRDDIEHALARQFQYPYLREGEGGFGKELVAAYKPFTPKVEALRVLRSQLMLRWFSAGHKSLAIVSAGRHEGRSYLAANLAVVFSQLGDRTLLVDADLKYPRQHQIFRLENSPGLSPTLVGRTSGKLVVCGIPQFKNLSVLPAGTPPPNPDELLARDELEQIRTQLIAEYDVVIFDTPAGATGGGAEIVASRCGGALMVARRNRTSLSDARAFTERLRSRSEWVGSVLNRF